MSDSQATPAMQRYAAEVFRIQQDTPQVSLSILADNVESSPQAIARMVKRLTDAGYATYEPYRGIRLTMEGERIAMPALRRHRLGEVFLVKVMGYDWAAAHELTDVFERGMNGELEDRMAEMAGNPTRCPHGEPIPSKDGTIIMPQDAPLVDMEPGSAWRLSRVRTHDMDKLRYIGNLGLTPGVEFTLVSRAPFNGPLRLQFERSDQVIGYELASSLWVEKA
ncbi:MAG: metal-dependent transcriptional regulator [Anaerolineales bacterium]|nr:metal-dependent transcriptional regulator [Anaerolineales bacterium]MCW5856612.1 metal-dependent transcriptional regulator [Anaerolineales bacterium]